MLGILSRNRNLRGKPSSTMQPVGSGGGRGYATSCMKPGTKTEAFYDPTKLKRLNLNSCVISTGIIEL